METVRNLQTEVILEKNRTKVNDKRSYLQLKRFIDLFGSIIGIILLGPVLLIVAFLIKIEDPKGSVIYKQTRIGINGKPFKMYKFRSMVANAEELLKELIDQNEVDGPMFKMKEDPRVTKIGKFIRKTSIDELPQLWNVIKGEMSLVGPRPPLPREVELYSEYDKLRLTVKPGCTGLWQVSGRNELSFNDMVELDIKYIRESSIALDIVLILKTIKVMVKKEGY